MRRGTTPTITMELDDNITVNDIAAATLSIAQNGKEVISKNLNDMTADGESNTLTVTLTQAETLMLDRYITAEIQLKVKIGDDVTASDIIETKVKDIINEEVL